MTAANTNTLPFQPAFTRVQQTEYNDCAFACIAMLAGKTIAEVRQVAIEKFRTFAPDENVFNSGSFPIRPNKITLFIFNNF